jgi:crossover junction endodeoxyribonuclease RuvC
LVESNEHTHDFLGVDQSLNGTGLALIRANGTCVATTTIIVGKRKDAERLFYIQQEVCNFIKLYHVTYLNVKTSIDVAMEGGSFKSTHRGFALGEISGVLQTFFFSKKYPIVIVPPLLVKKFATGNGGASKQNMIDAVKTLWNVSVENDNEADALVLAHIARSVIYAPTQHRCQMEVIKKLLSMQSKPGIKVRLRSPKTTNL